MQLSKRLADEAADDELDYEGVDVEKKKVVLDRLEITEDMDSINFRMDKKEYDFMLCNESGKGDNKVYEYDQVASKYSKKEFRLVLTPKREKKKGQPEGAPAAATAISSTPAGQSAPARGTN